MTTKVKLKIILKAGNTLVAEVENPILWQKVLSAIHSSNSKSAQGVGDVLEEEDQFNEPKSKKKANETPIAQLATQIGVSENELKGAIDPTTESPYIHLDRHCWEALKKQTPQRGIGAISPVGLVGTLLSLWFTAADLGNPTQKHAHEVLNGIGINDKNPTRGIKSTNWLQGRQGGVIVLNPAQISKALSIAKSFCTKNWKPEKE